MGENTPIDAVTEVAKTGKSFLELANNMLAPVRKRMETAAELHEIDAKIKFAEDHPEVEFVIKEDGTPGFITSSQQELAIRAGRRLLAEAERKQYNLEQVYVNAAKEIDDVSAEPEKSIDDDWLTRLNSIVEDVSDEEMQFVWGKILAGEYKKPGSFSMRTLDVVRNLSRADAELFEKIAPFVIQKRGDLFIPAESEFRELLNNNNVYYSHLMKLFDSGLLRSTQAELNLFINREEQEYWHNGHQVLVILKEVDQEKRIQVSVNLLTSAGKELFSILEATPDREFFFDFAKQIKRKNEFLRMSIHNIISITDSMIRYSNEETIV